MTTTTRRAKTVAEVLRALTVVTLSELPNNEKPVMVLLDLDPAGDRTALLPVTGIDSYIGAETVNLFVDQSAQLAMQKPLSATEQDILRALAAAGLDAGATAGMPTRDGAMLTSYLVAAKDGTEIEVMIRRPAARYTPDPRD